MEKIRVGFVGLGGICRERHVPGLTEIPDVEIVAVANRSRESSEAAAGAFGIPNVCGSWRELVQREDVDAVFIGTWPYMHREVSVAALEAGKHVFCQARMARNLEEARAMLAAARNSDRVAALCPVPFGLSVDKVIARVLREGDLGDVRFVRVQSFSGAWADPEAPATWRKDHRLSGLNVQTLGMYAEVIHRWFGWTRTVSALTQTFVPERETPGGERIEVQIPDQAVFNTIQDKGVAVQYAIIGTTALGGDAIEIFGSKGRLYYDVGADVLYKSVPTDEAPTELPVLGRSTEAGLTLVPIREDEAYDVTHWRVEQDFIDAIREGKPYHPDFEDGLRYMQVVQAVHDSATAGRTITIDGEAYDVE